MYEKQLKPITMSKGHTDKQLLVKGLKYMAITIPLLILTVYLFTLSFLNTESKIIYYVLPLAFVGMTGTIWLGFKGIKTILKSIFH